VASIRTDVARAATAIATANGAMGHVFSRTDVRRKSSAPKGLP
jgi:hypothetical protein